MSRISFIIFSLYVLYVQTDAIQKCSKNKNRFWQTEAVIELGLKYPETPRLGGCVVNITNNTDKHSVHITGYGINMDYVSIGSNEDIVGVAQGIYNDYILVTAIFTAAKLSNPIIKVTSTDLTITCTELDCNGVITNMHSRSITIIGTCIHCVNVTTYPDYMGKIGDKPYNVNLLQLPRLKNTNNVNNTTTSKCNVPFDDVQFYLCDRIDMKYPYVGHPRLPYETMKNL
ncbi:NFkB inhibitor [Eptesipox virus]|uniref:Early protein OPG038 n=1 Tax=Eptesipox virus TaxID=1329402 RepID=A0A220T6N0_9POXV|nr:NFkB inhibitor [Eptesipox virus]ASK51374.1 NFkB inhibitor [Eptesipox virus]WAH71132.1 NFkB inhibitor [Eptesipox virus]